VIPVYFHFTLGFFTEAFMLYFKWLAKIQHTFKYALLAVNNFPGISFRQLADCGIPVPN